MVSFRDIFTGLKKLEIDPDRPVIGPAPDGTDPSIDFGGLSAPSLPLVLKRSQR